jgi:enterochelin esterase-like enzyme
LGLTSPALAVLLALAAAAAAAGALWWWRRLAGPGWRALVLRAGLLGLLQLSVVSLVFVLANRSAEFYSSWSDLLGTDHGSAAIVAVGSGPGQVAAALRVLSSAPVATAGKPRVAGGWLETVQIQGQLSGLTAPGYVYVPPHGAQAWPPAPAAPRLPVLVVISDQLSSQDAPYSAQRLAATAAAQIAARRLEPILIVMLPARVGGPSGPADQGCLDVPGGVQARTYFAQDLPQAVESAYRVASPPGGWALLGDSAGAYCAVQLAMTNSQVFAAAAAPPGEFQRPPGPAESGGSAQLQAQDNLLWQLQHEPMQPISVLFTGPGAAQQFRSLVRPPMRAGSISLPAGAWPLAPVLDWIGATIGPPS